MTKIQMDSYMDFLNEKYKNLNDSHIRVIKNYTKDLITYDEYKRLDEVFGKQLETLKSVIESFLYFKNQNL